MAVATPFYISSLFLPSRSFVRIFLSLRFKACTLIPLSWDRLNNHFPLLYYFVLPISRLFFCHSPPTLSDYCRPTLSFGLFVIRHILTHASSIITCFGSCFRASRLFCQRCVKFKGGAVVDANVEANQPHQAPTQQRTTTPKVFNRNIILSKCYLDLDVNHAAQSTRIRPTQRSKPAC